nr:immunoglobulin heavy chain junction region [Macaca mulatta]MOX39077.1 immunoglobulin heavy chain junction region [Macaca mulatta]MOX40133.1 immunoglobulin heavy chain junction region [Macaca mulatta]MOX40320.1 immunoglobulin heavy chain junction region [Macaca mulatta]MOX40578.1 immunoglobulin heavy chain junction region [Macaca mulatta]
CAGVPGAIAAEIYYW